VRRPIVAANWKMHKTAAEAATFVRNLEPLLESTPTDQVDVLIAAPFTALAALGPALAGGPVGLAAQNMHPEDQGAFTGEISAGMLLEVGCTYVVLGHSERRALFGESSDFVAEKLRSAQAAGLTPIVCVGESRDEREAGRTFEVVGRQLEASLAGGDRARADEFVIAYEPVWAIGTGLTASPDQAQEVHAHIRERLSELVGRAAARIRIQYGGSVKPDNAAELMGQPDIDGALVGGASLDPESFCAIIRGAAPLP